MRRMNVQGELRSRLAAALDPVAVHVHVPAERPAELVTVRRTGGSAERRVYEDVSVEVQAWATTEARAYDLIEGVRDVFAALTFADGFADVQELTVKTDYDLVAECPRWYAKFQLKTYQPND